MRQSLNLVADLCGRTARSAVAAMLALEDRFDIEFPVRRLTRETSASLAVIAETVTELADD